MRSTYWIVTFLCLAISACGGSDGETTTQAPAPVQPSEPQAPPLTIEEQQLVAARLLNQATFGATKAEIDAVVDLGIEAWLDMQIDATPSYHFPLVAPYIDNDDFWRQYRIEAWWQNTLYAEDQLRQRVAFALSQILVVSEFNGILAGSPESLAQYYDLLVSHAFGNYRELIEDVTLSPAMGAYLSMLGNEKPDEERNIRPDENYARELMQLFTIGLTELNTDGTQKLDQQGKTIPTYDQETIKGFAHVFTGWHFNGTTEQTWYRWWENFNLLDPMTSVAAFHDTESKTLFSSVTLPADQTAEKDLNDALDTLFNHPNLPPFISKQLIQKLVTSNPSPEYVARVTQVFINDGTNVRGNLAAVIKAILVDDEARNGHETMSDQFGKIREPIIRAAHMWRAFDVKTQNEKVDFSWPEYFFGQAPLASPSVFNFYSPSYSPVQLKTEYGLLAPELQIATESTMTNTINFFAWYGLWRPYSEQAEASDEQNNDQHLQIDLTNEVTLAQQSSAELIEHLNLVLTAGALSEEAQTLLIEHYDEEQYQNETKKIANLIFLILSSPQYAVQR